MRPACGKPSWITALVLAALEAQAPLLRGDIAAALLLLLLRTLAIGPCPLLFTDAFALGLCPLVTHAFALHPFPVALAFLLHALASALTLTLTFT